MGINIMGDVAKFEKKFLWRDPTLVKLGKGKIHSFKEVPLSLV